LRQEVMMMRRILFSVLALLALAVISSEPAYAQ
jgi:hypothetical protein